MIAAMCGLRLQRLLMLIRRARSAETEAWSPGDRSVARVEMRMSALSFCLLTLVWIMGVLFMLTGKAPTVMKLLVLLAGASFLVGTVIYLRAWSSRERTRGSPR